MAFENGIVKMHYGGALSTDPQDPEVTYVGGMVEEIGMDIDEASYSEVKYHVKAKQFPEYCFLIYFKHPDRGLVRLFDDDSSRNFSDVLRLYGTAVVYVQHGTAINRDFISPGLSSRLNVDLLQHGTGRTSVVVGGFSDRVGANSSDIEHNKANKVVSDLVSDDQSSDSSDEEQTHEEEDWIDDNDIDNLEDDDDDEELRSSRQKIKEKMVISRSKGNVGLADALKKLHGLAADSQRKAHEIDVESDGDSDDSYETESDDEDLANNQMFPIAWAQVDVENTDNWEWFFCHLGADLNLKDGHGWVVISDRQKPGTPLERAIDMHSGGSGSGSLPTARPQVVSNPPTSSRLQTLSSEQSGTSRLSSLAPPPLPLEHAGFKRSGVLCIPGNGGLTASQIRAKLTKTTKGDKASSSTRKSKMAKCTQESTNLEK